MLGSQLGIFFILILFEKLLYDKIFLEQEKKLIRNSFLRIDRNFMFGSFEINSKMWYTVCVYHIFEFITQCVPHF